MISSTYTPGAVSYRFTIPNTTIEPCHESLPYAGFVNVH